ncbi:hypothetical protein METHPM2_820006 [Pseudomonas sp. PM2]
MVGIAHGISARHQSPVGAGLPAMAEGQSINLQLNHRYRRQAPPLISTGLKAGVCRRRQ